MYELQGIPLFVYGNSYTQPPVSGRATIGGDWPARVASRLHMGALANRGLSGSVMGQVAYEINNNVSGATPSRTWSQGTRGLVVIEEVVNDCVTFGSSAKAQTAYAMALRTCIELLSAGTRYDAPNAAFSYTGTWTSGTAWLKNSGKRSTVNGSKVTFSVTGDAVTLYWMGNTGTTDYVTATVKSGGVQVATIDTRNQMDAYNSPGSVGTGIDVNLCCTRLTGLGAGTHSIEVALTSVVGTKGFYFDGYSTPAAEPPQIILVKEGIISSYLPNGSDAARTAFNGIIGTVAAEYPANVSVADPGANWDSSCLYPNDGVGNHPNDKGNSVLADAVADAALALGFRNGMHILS
ncbi:esterase [Arthrobacter phage BruhMoment]|nr:esterase [Arthrobacter phage BruhMoment]